MLIRQIADAFLASKKIQYFIWVLPVLYGGICILLSFNGLYGQDAHEYLRQSRDFFVALQGGSYLPKGLGAAEYAVGFPLAGALMQLIIGDSVLALQLVSLLASGMAFYFFEKSCALLAPGTRGHTRLLYAGIILGCAPVFVRSAMVSMSDMLGVALVLATFWSALRYLDHGRGHWLLMAAFCCGLSVITRFALGALFLPLVLVLVWRVISKRQWLWGFAAAAFGFVAVWPHFWLKMEVTRSTLAHSLANKWSVFNLFYHSFTNENGTVDYGLPNGLYILFPVCHPFYFLLLPLLFFLVKKTDFLQPNQRVICICLVVYLLFLGGIPHQNIRYLLPAYTLLLLLFFPAWDRFISYGFYFLKQWKMWSILLFFIILQGFLTVKNFWPTLERNHFEQKMAADIRSVLPSNVILYSFDVDIALQSYLPDLESRNLWVERYASFPEGAYIVFNEPLLRPQWQGLNPILNWDFVVEHYVLKEEKSLENGWKLYRVLRKK